MFSDLIYEFVQISYDEQMSTTTPRSKNLLMDKGNTLIIDLMDRKIYPK